MSCFSPIDDVCLLYSEKYLKPPEKKNVIYIPLCDGVHFQGYIVNIKEHKIIQISSLRWNQPENPTSFQIAKMLLKIQSKPLNPFFRKENSLMLTAVVYGLPLECLCI